MKPHLALVLFWAALRREWRFAAAIGATLAVVLATSVVHYGLGAHVDYVHALSFLGRHGESFYPNQSFVGLLHRAIGNGNNVEWQANAFPPFHVGVFAAGVVVSLALLGAALFGLCDAVQLRLQGTDTAIPYEVFLALPYVVTLLAMVVRARDSRTPSALGTPFVRGAA